jgi:16S rRNA (cytidine1402-2'-O)-methyltransferase
MIFVFYESARRINGTLGILSQSSWIREVVIGRELTKKFEEIMHGKPENLLKMEFKGETTLLVI